MRYDVDQFINCTAFDKVCNIWSIAQHTCNIVRIRIKVILGLGLGLGLGFGLVLWLWLGLGLHNWPNVQHVWSNAQNVPYNNTFNNEITTKTSSM